MCGRVRERARRGETARAELKRELIRVTDEDVEDVLALSIEEEGGEGDQVKTAEVAKAMLMSPGRRKENAERRRKASDPRQSSDR